MMGCDGQRAQLLPISISDSKPRVMQQDRLLRIGLQLPLFEPANETIAPCLTGLVDALLCLLRQQSWPSLWP